MGNALTLRVPFPLSPINICNHMLLSLLFSRLMHNALCNNLNGIIPQSDCCGKYFVTVVTPLQDASPDAINNVANFRWPR